MAKTRDMANDETKRMAKTEIEAATKDLCTTYTDNRLIIKTKLATLLS